MLWMDVDEALAEVPVNTVPLTDSTDFVSIETGVAHNATGMALTWHFVTTAGAYTATPVTPTSGGAYDWAHQAQGMYTIEIPASGGASINNDTEGFGYFTGVCDGVLPWRGPTIGFRAAGKNNLLIDDAHSATRGLAGTALPDAAAGSNGGLLRIGTNSGHVEITDGLEIGGVTAGRAALSLTGAPGDGVDFEGTQAGPGLFIAGGAESEENWNAGLGVHIEDGILVVSERVNRPLVTMYATEAGSDGIVVNIQEGSALKLSSTHGDSITLESSGDPNFAGISIFANEGPGIRIESASADAVMLSAGGRIGIAQGIPRGVDFDNFDFPMYDAQGNLAPGLTIDAVVRIDNGTFVPCANAVSEVGGGIYTIDLDGDADLDARKVTLLFTDADSDSNIRPTMIQVVLEQ